MRAALYDVDDKQAGFIVYTPYSQTFFRKALKKHWLNLSVLMAASIAFRPHMLFRIVKVLRTISHRSKDSTYESPCAEILAIGVYPEYLSPGFIHRTGLRIGQELFEHAVSYFKRFGSKTMRLAVDEFNKPALFFYHSLGGRFEPIKRAGDAMIQIWFDLEKQFPDTGDPCG